MEKKKSASSFNESSSWLVTALFAGLVIRVILCPFPGHVGDLSFHKMEGTYGAEHGVTHVYDLSQNVALIDATGDSSVLYPPLAQYYFTFVIKIVKPLLGFKIPKDHPFDIDLELNGFFKTPAMLSDLFITLLIFLFLYYRFDKSIASKAALLWWLNPGVIYESSYWGQIDSVQTFFAFSALIAALLYATCEDESVLLAALSACLFSAAVLVKPQSAFPLFPLALFLVAQRGKIRGLTVFILMGLIGAVTMCSPYLLEGTYTILPKIYTWFFHSQPMTSAGAPNIWLLQKYYYATHLFLGISLQGWGWIFFVIGMIYGFTHWLKAWQEKDIARTNKIALVLITAAFLSLCFFMLPTAMRGRYLMPSILFLAMTTSLDRRLNYLFWAYTATYVLSLHFVMPATPSELIVNPFNVAFAMAKRNLMIYMAIYNVFNFFFFAYHFPGILNDARASS